jgi:hypothetical protein
MALAELGILVVCIVVMTVVHDTAPAGTWDFPGHQWAYRSWQHAVFYLAVDGYALTVWLVGVRRAAVLGRRLTNPLARTAFWLVIVGSAGMAAAHGVLHRPARRPTPAGPRARWMVAVGDRLRKDDHGRARLRVGHVPDRARE